MPKLCRLIWMKNIEESIFMNNLNYIRSLLKAYIDRKVNKFIIYPFGSNGIQVKNILKDCFDLEPCGLVDNVYSQYNPKIMNKEELKKYYQEDMYIILSIMDAVANAKIYDELIQYVPCDHIINIVQQQYSEEVNYEGKGFLLKDFLPRYLGGSYVRQENKIKVRIMVGSPSIWEAVSSVCQAFSEDLLFDVLLIVGGWRESHVIGMIKNSYKYVLISEYQGQEDKPDILILCGHFNKVAEGMLACRKHLKLVIVVYWSIVRYHATIQEFLNSLKEDFGLYRPDYYIFDSLQYNEVKQSEYFTGKLVEIGNAKFDGIYKSMQNKEYSSGWEKLKGKITILWAGSHGLGDNLLPAKSLTFDLYAKTFFEYADKNPDMGFIFRPHPAFVEDMIKYGFWSHNDFVQLKKYCADSHNLVYDDMETYGVSLSIADGILTDAFCGIVCSALPTLKPICAAYRSKRDVSWHKALLDNLYAAYESGDIINFFELIKKKEDPMLELRKQACETYVKNFDGRNGWRIKEFVKDKWMERFGI